MVRRGGKNRLFSFTAVSFPGFFPLWSGLEGLKTIQPGSSAPRGQVPLQVQGKKGARQPDSSPLCYRFGPRSLLLPRVWSGTAMLFPRSKALARKLASFKLYPTWMQRASFKVTHSSSCYRRTPSLGAGVIMVDCSKQQVSRIYQGLLRRVGAR